MAAREIIVRSAHDQKVRNVLLTLIILLSLSGVVHAEQTPTIKYLMSEPLTLFDLGIYKLDKLINEDQGSFIMPTS